MNKLPDYHCKPKIRLQKPISLQLPNNHPPAPLRPYEFHELSPNELKRNSQLVYDPITQSNSVVGGPRFSGDFECGNLGQVFLTGPKEYEIHLLPDPNESQTTQWFFFKVENLEPGEYAFTIVGFYRQCNLHWKGSKAAVYSENASKSGIGWQRIGENLNYYKFKGGKFPEWAFFFTFNVVEKDTMYFAHAYPYTYTDLNNFLQKLSSSSECKVSTLCKTFGDIPVPAVFWDADKQKCVDVSNLYEKRRVTHEAPEIRVEDISEFSEALVEILRAWKESGKPSSKSLPPGISHNSKPVIIIAARTHPGETNSSFAMEGLMTILFGNSQLGQRLRQNFSWLLIPMVNPDGVICGFYRPSLAGYDVNRVWQSPDPTTSPVAYNILNLLESLRRTRPLLFFLDFHGHTAACNSFVYGFMNEENNDLYSAERVFPLLMTKYSPLFSNEMCSFLKQKQYEGTMRVVIRRRFLVLFAYTLEMSYGGCDFGPRRNSQFTPGDYRSVGEATAYAIGDLLLSPSSLAAKEAMLLLPPPEAPPRDEININAQISISGEARESRPGFFNFSAADLTAQQPRQVNLVLKQMVRDNNVL
ncbi:Clan MC, family M14, Zinc carboxypeptidase-like metallopeptidase [Tritrichomonas foetus]|uniref:Clan MC, family M14, Zinc carboxypeptidase-like metallopeptidase n=1 Tax=Tritrichomonas foetus TaxID=1144522 RepID=A0A1J4KBI7_9EUKA|nr:Clan MC, family M14, Zinc carboxypeptidase-like metallopeptidase [Tritrichomonas foetus]|eukprot:OHT08777.1 Clan MC, family M14, Zinc carboxypeptidase-like metallopeptidase [Tritrichomonas foetus]